VPYVADIDRRLVPVSAQRPGQLTRHADGPHQLDFTISRQRWIAARLTSVGVCDFEEIIIAIASSVICSAKSIAASRFIGVCS
jgi:hypothetical protein